MFGASAPVESAKQLHDFYIGEEVPRGWAVEDNAYVQFFQQQIRVENRFHTSDRQYEKTPEPPAPRPYARDGDEPPTYAKSWGRGMPKEGLSFDPFKSGFSPYEGWPQTASSDTVGRPVKRTVGFRARVLGPPAIASPFAVDRSMPAFARPSEDAESEAARDREAQRKAAAASTRRTGAGDDVGAAVPSIVGRALTSVPRARGPAGDGDAAHGGDVDRKVRDKEERRRRRRRREREAEFAAAAAESSPRAGGARGSPAGQHGAATIGSPVRARPVTHAASSRAPMLPTPIKVRGGGFKRDGNDEGAGRSRKRDTDDGAVKYPKIGERRALDADDPAGSHRHHSPSRVSMLTARLDETLHRPRPGSVLEDSGSRELNHAMKRMRRRRERRLQHTRRAEEKYARLLADDSADYVPEPEANKFAPPQLQTEHMPGYTGAKMHLMSWERDQLKTPEGFAAEQARLSRTLGTNMSPAFDARGLAKAREPFKRRADLNKTKGAPGL